MTSHQLSQLALCSLLFERWELSNCPPPPLYTHPRLLPGLGQRLWAAPLKSVTYPVSLETLGALALSGVSWSWGMASADGGCSVLNMLSPTWERNAGVLQPRPRTESLALTLAL